MALNMRPSTDPSTAGSTAGLEPPVLPASELGLAGPASAPVRSRPVQRLALLASYGVLAVLVGVLLLVATATVPVLFGYHSYTIEGGSMAPSLKAGSVAVVAPTSPRALRVGDIIAWRSSARSAPVLHRIVAVTYEDGEPRFVTQGDQNRTPDATPVALAGPGDRVVYSVPYAGYILDFAARMPGRVALIEVPLALLAAFTLREGRPSAEPRGRPEVQTGAAGRQPASPPVAISPMMAAAANSDSRGGSIFTAERQPPPAPMIFTVERPPPQAWSGPNGASPFAASERQLAPALAVVRPMRAPADNSDLPAFLLRQLRHRLPSPAPAPAPLALRRLPAGEAGPRSDPRAA